MEATLRAEVGGLRESDEGTKADLAACKRDAAEGTSQLRAALERCDVSERHAASLSTQQEAMQAQLAALQSLPARKFFVRATAPGYAQANYLDGPISLYYEHLVIDARGQPQREVLVEMERRVAACWLSVTDVRSGSALPTAQIQLVEEGVVAHAFDAPGPHDVAAVEAVSQTYDIQLRLAGYVLQIGRAHV